MTELRQLSIVDVEEMRDTVDAYEDTLRAMQAERKRRGR